MKKIIVISLIVSAITLLFPAAFAIREPETGSLWYSPSPLVTLLDSGETLSMTLEEYLVGAVAAEMPASFELEALKAQAVALRTYAMRKKYVEPSQNHAETVCSDIACCAAWESESALREKWGGDFDFYYGKITAAVNGTRGVYLSYDNEMALAVFHSSSPGRTEASENVWTSAVPYLVSVETPESAETVPDFIRSTTFSPDEFTEVFLQKHPGADFSGAASDWIKGAEYLPSGRLASVEIGGERVTGREVRELFGMRSADLSFEVSEIGITLTSVGYGHGVGMSQYGANVMASGGADYREILSTYYPGTELLEI